ncbi:MAG: hypothetical protein AMXMBFR84_42060 [Candidatus Hydrogenedentota bacterium]
MREQGFELVEVEFLKQGYTWTLRLYVDKPGGITLDDCADVSRLLSPILDEADFVEGNYVLEVSSPGIDRPIRKPHDFERYVGMPVRIKTLAPVQGRRNFRGVLTAFTDGMATVECDGSAYSLHLENVHKANLDR